MPTPLSWRIIWWRKAYRSAKCMIVGEAVVEAIAQGKPLEALTLADLQKFSPVIADDVYPILSWQPASRNAQRKAASRRSR